MVAGRSVEDKVSDWLRAYYAVAGELTDEAMRAIVKLVNAKDAAAIRLGIEMSKIISANNRAAAYTAALLTANGVKPVPVSFEGDADEG